MPTIKKLIDQELINQKIINQFNDLCEQHDIDVDSQINSLCELVIRLQIANGGSLKQCCESYEQKFIRNYKKIKNNKFIKEIN
tara:strand:- start:119 stop:367 length:249 start_codon:yes stop_codon:yes gene_type:complete